jgi:lipopolysaccharide export system permease protein
VRPRVLDRYVAGQFLRILGLVTLGAPVLFILIDATDNLGKYLGRVSLGQAALGYLYQVPYYAVLSVPIGALCGAVFTIHGMTRHNEITAAKASGISFHRLWTPMLVVATFAAAATLALGEVVPHATRRSLELLGEREMRHRTVRTQFVYRADGGRAYVVRRLDAAAGEIRGLVIEREGTGPEYPSVQIVADRATWDPAGRWVLRNGTLRYVPAPDRVVHFGFRELVSAGFRERPDDLLAEPKEPEEMGYAELGRFIESIRRSGGDPRKLVVERMFKIAYPVSCLIIVLFGAPLATTSRRGGAAYGVAVAIATVMTYLILFRVAQGLGTGGVLPPAWAAWAPNAVFLAAALVLLTRVRT